MDQRLDDGLIPFHGRVVEAGNATLAIEPSKQAPNSSSVFGFLCGEFLLGRWLLGLLFFALRERSYIRCCVFKDPLHDFTLALVAGKR